VTAPELGPDRSAIRALHRVSQERALARLLHAATLPADLARRVDARARQLVRAARTAHKPGSDITDFLREYSLASREGIALLCLAEALLRIPDSATADALIEDLIASADWQAHLGQADSLTVNASAWAFMLTGRVLALEDADNAGVAGAIRRMVQRLGEPVIRTALRQGMRVLARQFVMGRTIGEALARAQTTEGKRWRYSFDMLGEAARTHDDAVRYMRAYRDASGAIGKAGGGPVAGPGISVKLSALHPRFEPLQETRCVPALIESLGALALEAKTQNIGLSVDAEEADRLEITLDIFAAILSDPRLAGWDGLGMVVQAYQKRAPAIIDWLAELARATHHRIPVRLVKGAYWDSEIKFSQLRGDADYPVFTRKPATDVSWIACARHLLDRRDVFHPQFATHNALSFALILESAGNADFEMQRLHGMGEALYGGIVGENCPVRVYAPVGSHEDLLAYLVRRLLENGANTSFVHRLVDPAVPEDAIVADPAARLHEIGVNPNPRIPLPSALYPDRKNSSGLDLADRAVAPAPLTSIRSTKIPRALPGSGAVREIRDPADRTRLIGTAPDATQAEIDSSLASLARNWRAWDDRGGAARADILDRAADRIEAARDEFLFLLAREAGRTLADGISEVREAADFCRWYAARAREHFATPRELPGPTGERNTWSLGGRGVFACISPWNFPLAIFTGQVAAALAAGNAVIAKPAEQTPFIAARAVALLHEAGVPANTLRLATGDGRVGAALINDPRIAGVAFTGGTDTAQGIARTLAARPGPLIPFIAETGGVNAMIVDSSALPEQVVVDVLSSAFGSAGQRCSALRLLCLQEETADRMLAMLRGAAATLTIGDPLDPATDIGPVIDEEARTALEIYAAAAGPALFRLELPPACEHGTFFAPRAIALPDAGALKREIFGPILHVVRYAAGHLDALLDAIDATGYGLTLGVHSRISAVQRHIVERLGVGNAYVNRNQIGAVVGVQPFGGRGLSGTGPKAGGPITLYRFAEERVVSINTAAAGGNAALLAQDEG
jgi:RHH-type proline utilization regulon transcriptional repressor/proline dehydrogenase/delta 1-pyrroline-5-carboxylate dehydrogenase